jgi:hypothetical protein
MLDILPHFLVAGPYLLPRATGQTVKVAPHLRTFGGEAWNNLSSSLPRAVGFSGVLLRFKMSLHPQSGWLQKAPWRALEGGKPIAPGKRSAARGLTPHSSTAPVRGDRASEHDTLFCRPSRASHFLHSRPRAAPRLPGATCCAPFQGASLLLWLIPAFPCLILSNERRNGQALPSRTARGGGFPNGMRSNPDR